MSDRTDHAWELCALISEVFELGDPLEADLYLTRLERAGYHVVPIGPPE